MDILIESPRCEKLHELANSQLIAGRTGESEEDKCFGRGGGYKVEQGKCRI